jgi:hypothetical protein
VCVCVCVCVCVRVSFGWIERLDDVATNRCKISFAEGPTGCQTWPVLLGRMRLCSWRVECVGVVEINRFLAREKGLKKALFFFFVGVNQGVYRRSPSKRTLADYYDSNTEAYRKTIPIAVYLLQSRRCAEKGSGSLLVVWILITEMDGEEICNGENNLRQRPARKGLSPEAD